MVPFDLDVPAVAVNVDFIVPALPQSGVNHGAKRGVVLTGQLVVDNVALAQVVAEIERHFTGRIMIASSDLAARRVSGTFTVTDTDAALALLRESLGMTVTKLGPLIVLRI